VQVQVVGPDGKPTTQTISILDKSQTGQLLQQIQASILGVSGQGGDGSQIHGPMDLNGFSITNVSNGDNPLPHEALAYGTAQSRYNTYRQAIKQVSADYNVQAADGTVQVNAAAGPVTVTLPPPDTVTAMVFPVIKSDSSGNAVTVVSAKTRNKNQAATINGAANASLAAQWDKGLYQSDGTNYIIVG
jgi:hypothetical protein